MVGNVIHKPLIAIHKYVYKYAKLDLPCAIY